MTERHRPFQTTVDQSGIKQWLNDNHIQVIQDPKEWNRAAEYIKMLQPKAVLEVGVKYGGSLALLANLMDEGLIVGVDLNGLRKDKLEKLQQRVAPEIKIVKGDSHDQGVPVLVWDLFLGKQIDVLHIDGDHSYDGLDKDFKMYAGLVRPGGFIMIHDIKGTPGILEVNKWWEGIKPICHGQWIEIINEDRPSNLQMGIGIIVRKETNHDAD